MKTSKSPKRVAQVAYEVAKQSLPAYSHRCSPKKFTLPQLVVCLVLREFFTTDYRGIVGILEDSSELRAIVELKQVPHYTTIQKAGARLSRKSSMQQLMGGILKRATEGDLMGEEVSLAALDGTGLESHHVSRYFVHRREAQAEYFRRGFPKVGLICDTSNHLILAGVPERGPQFDRTHFQAALQKATGQKSMGILLADAGYDAEANHVHAREAHGIRMVIPATHAKRSDRLPRRGFYRRLMRTCFPVELYRQRWQVETVISMLKRNLGSCLRARTYWSQCREILLRLLTHNIMIVLRTA